VSRKTLEYYDGMVLPFLAYLDTTEDLIVRLLVGSGIRRAEVCGLAVNAPDGLPDLMVDSMQRGRVELRVRWDGSATSGWPRSATWGRARTGWS